LATPPDGSVGGWGLFTAQYVGLVDGVQQHVGDIFASKAKAASGAGGGTGDWSREGELFSWRDPGVDNQPPNTWAG
jgi:hypothetical protein